MDSKPSPLATYARVEKILRDVPEISERLGEANCSITGRKEKTENFSSVTVKVTDTMRFFGQDAKDSPREIIIQCAARELNVTLVPTAVAVPPVPGQAADASAETPKRGRGRPRKVAVITVAGVPAVTGTPVVALKRRGRPPKAVVETFSLPATPVLSPAAPAETSIPVPATPVPVPVPVPLAAPPVAVSESVPASPEPVMENKIETPADPGMGSVTVPVAVPGVIHKRGRGRPRKTATEAVSASVPANGSSPAVNGNGIHSAVESNGAKSDKLTTLPAYSNSYPHIAIYSLLISALGLAIEYEAKCVDDADGRIAALNSLIMEYGRKYDFQMP